MWISNYMIDGLLLDSVVEGNYNVPVIISNMINKLEDTLVMGVAPSDISDFTGPVSSLFSSSIS